MMKDYKIKIGDLVIRRCMKKTGKTYRGVGIVVKVVDENNISVYWPRNCYKHTFDTENFHKRLEVIDECTRAAEF